MGVKYDKKGNAIYTVDKGINLNHKAKFDKSKIQMSSAQRKSYADDKKKKNKKTNQTKSQAAKRNSGITGGAAQAAKEYRKKTPKKKTEKKKNKAREYSKKIRDQKLTSNEKLLLQNLTRTGSPDVVRKGLQSAGKTLTTSKAKTKEYKNLNKRVAKQDEKFLNSSPVAYGFMAGSSPIPLKETLERQTGKKINTKKAEKSRGYKAGYMGGLMAEYTLTGGLARASAQKGIEIGAKQLAKNTSKKAIAKVVKKGEKLPKAVKRISSGLAADTITGLPTNALEAGKESMTAGKGEKGKTFAKSLALNTALDVGFGGAMEALPAAVKGAKAAKASRSSYIPKEVVPKESRKVYKEYIRSNDKGVAKFAEKAQAGELSKRASYKLSDVTTDEAERLKELTGVDTTGYTHSLKANTVDEHIMKHHGAKGSADSSMADINDLSRINYIIKNADDVEVAKNANGTVDLSREFLNSDGSGAPKIKYTKKIDGHYYVVEAVPDSGKKKIQVVTAYIEKPGIKKTVHQVGDVTNAPPRTSETGLNDTVFDNSVAPIDKAVNDAGAKKAADQLVDVSRTPSSHAHDAVGATANNSISPVKAVSKNVPEELPDARNINQNADRNVMPDARKPENKVRGRAKADKIERRNIREFDKTVKEALGITKYEDNPKIKDLINKTAEKIKEGALTKKDRDELFDQIFKEGVNVDVEFFEKYKPLKQELRNKALAVTDDIKQEIKDFDSFRKQNMGTLRLSKEGRSIDVEYAELRGRYPELFPEKNTPAEMLEEISRVAKSIKANETKISALYGDELDEFVKYSKEKFNEALDRLDEDLHIVKRYLKRPEIMTRKEMSGTMYDIARFKREADKVKQNVLLTNEDRGLVDLMLSGKMNPETLNKLSPNSRDILKVYEAEKKILDAERPLKEIGIKTKAQYRQMADDALSNSDKFKDKVSGWRYNRETAERNVIDIAGKEDGEKIEKEFFEGVHDNEALATRFKNDYRNKVKELKISTRPVYDISGKDNISEILRRETGKKKLSEAAFVQMYGEGKITKEIMEAYGADVGKIENAVKVLRESYNDMIYAVNQELIRHGYPPIEYRKDYFPHFTEEGGNGVLAKVAKKLGVNIQTDDLPTDIAGLTHTFRPGKKWFAHALSRTGKNTEYDAIKGFDLYLEGIGDLIFHTEDIQKLRALEDAVRYKYSDKAVKDEIDSLTKAFKAGEIGGFEYHTLLDEIYKTKDNTRLNNFAVWLRNYTDGLAGKKSIGDRGWEHSLGRGIYSTTKALEGRLAANMVAVNPASWLTNFIPLVQAGSIRRSSLIRGMAQTLQNHIRKDNLMELSTFITNRKGSDVLWQSSTEKVQDILTRPMKWIDEFTSESLVRAKYLDEIKKGVLRQNAIRTADRFAADVIADRSKGALPVAFNSKNPVKKMFTMFQVEVNNQWSHLFKDIPRSSENVALTAAAFTNFFIASYVFNDVYEHLVGRRPAMDPLGWANDFLGDMTGSKMPNLVDAVEQAANGEGFSLEDVDKNKGAAVNLMENVAQDVPFIGGLIEGGRLPISSALPSVKNVANAVGGLLSGEAAPNKAWSAIGKEALKPATYLLPPVGGGQAKKIYEAGKVFTQQGDYGLDKEGNEQLKFSAERSAGNIAKGALFGKYAMGSGSNYVDNGFKMLSAKKTAAYKEAVKAGMKPSEAEAFIRNLPKKAQDARGQIYRSNLTNAQKNAIGKAIDDGDKTVDYSSKTSYKYSMLNKQQKEKVDELRDKGFTKESALKIRETVKGQSSQMAQVMALEGTGYDTPEVYAALGIKKSKRGNGPREKAKMLSSQGLSIHDFDAVKEAADVNGSGNVSIEEAMAFLDDTAYTRQECYALTFALTGCKHGNNPYR